MPASDILNLENSHSKRSTSIPHPPRVLLGQHHKQISLPASLAAMATTSSLHKSTTTTTPRRLSENEEWNRSIPEAGYVTLGTLRYGVRLSNGGRYSCGSESLPCRNSDSIDTCSVLVPPSVSSGASSGARPGGRQPQPLKAESPTCGNCCVGLTNGQCCDAGSPCFGNNDAKSHAIPQRNLPPQQQQRRQNFAKTMMTTTTTTCQQQQPPAMTPLKFAKNRTSTLSPSSSQPSTRTTSWCSSSLTAAAAPVPVVSQTTISRSASSADQRSRGSANHQSSSDRDLLSVSGSNSKLSFDRVPRGECCRHVVQWQAAAAAAGRIKQTSSIGPVIKKINSESSNSPDIVKKSGDDDSKRQRSLSPEEDLQSIGCFNLKSPVVIGKSSRETSLNSSGGSEKKFDKPTWLQICDPCHRILERSLTPDIVLLQEIKRETGRRKFKELTEVKEYSVRSPINDQDLRFIDSTSIAGADRDNPGDCGDSENKGRIVSDLQWKSDREKIDSVNNRSEYLFKGENNHFNNNIGANEIIIKRKVLLHSEDHLRSSSAAVRSRQRPEDHHQVEEANNNSGERHHHHHQQQLHQRRRQRQAAELLAERTHQPRSSSPSPLLGGGCGVVSAAVERRRCLKETVEETTQLFVLPLEATNSKKCENDQRVVGQQGVKCAIAVDEPAGEESASYDPSDSFEKDYEKCIESINQQLSQNAKRRTYTQPVTPSDPPEEVIMEKRRNTFERFQRWGFGQRSSSNNDLAATPPPPPGEPKKKDKTERLKELTELLKSTRIPSLTGFNRNTMRETSCSPPPVPPPRRQRTGLSVEKSFEKLESIEDNELPMATKLAQRKISVPSMKINERAASPGQIKITKPLHVSISSPHFKSLLEKSQQPPHTTDCNDIPVHAEELFSLPKVEPKTIVGSYTQKNIPYRSASFSQVDFNSGKYSLGSPELKSPKENRNSASMLESATYPRRRGDLRLLRNMKLGSPGPKAEQDQIIAEEGSPEHDDRRLSTLETIDSYDFDDHPVDGDPGAENVGGASSGSDKDVAVDANRNNSNGQNNNSELGLSENKETKEKDQVPTMLNVSEVGEKCGNGEVKKSPSSPHLPEDKNIYQTACEIPTPVFECCGKEVEQITEWFQLPHETLPSNQSTPAELINPGVPAVAITRSESGQSNSQTPKSDSPDSGRVELRKRNTFSSDSGNSKQSSLEKNDDTPPVEERRKIDKSKRRKGIYIQWPVTGLAKAPQSSWDMDSPDMLSPDCCDEKLKLNINLGLAAGANFDCLSTASCEPLTPDSDNYHQKLRWPNGGNKSDGGSRKKSLTYQSSEEKDDPPKDIHKRIALIRMDSTSDNESDRATSREPHSASPTPGCGDDLKRYSKRPLRGPYGQMLEAEMKKAAKVHYDEILDDLRGTDLKSTPRAPGRPNVSHSLDESAKNANNKLTKPRKTSAHLPIPFHERAASTPSHMDHQKGDEAKLSSAKKFPNSVEKLYYETPPPKKTSEPAEGRPLKSAAVFHSEAMLAAIAPSLPPSSPVHHKPCKRTASGFMDRSSRKRAEKASYSDSRNKHTSELVETPRGPMASNDLLAELLKGSSEKHHKQSVMLMGKKGNVPPIAKSLPQAVLKCLDTRTHVVIELFNTEQSYVESLQTVIAKYLNPLKSSDNLKDIVEAQLVDEIFYMVPSILGIHERFLEELHKRLGAWDQGNQKVGDAFIDVFSSSSVIEIYSCFVNNWNKAKSAIRTASAAKPAFARFLESMAREHKGKLSLDNLLIKPVQKFPNYELILSRLIKHTDADHPDQGLLLEANRLVHNILMHLNCKEREALENGQREATLRELEAVIEGSTDLVAADRTFLLFDLVSMFSGQTQRKERGLFLFNDALVIASIKKRTGTIKKPTTSFASSVAATLDTNKYKFLTKMSLNELEIAKAKDESVRKLMREIEQLSEDNSKIQKILEMMNAIRFPHQPLEDSIKELQKDVQKQLFERQANDTQLSILEFNVIASDINQNMSILFSKPEKRNQWEEAFSLAKQKLATSSEKNAVPEFVTMIPIRKTRAGLQFTCAASTIGPMNDVWVCNSDGYVGQVCVLSLYPEPTVTSCNGVCNARILCVTSVPPTSYIEPSNRDSSDQFRGSNDGDDHHGVAGSNSGTVEDGIHLESSSSCSSDNDSDIEFSGQLNLAALNCGGGGGSAASPPSELPLERLSMKEQSPAAVMTNVSSTASLAKSDTDDMDRTQSTMWLGTEDGCVHVYNCTDNIRIKKNKIKIQHSSAVYSILYLDNRVFVSLANGDICVYLRDNAGWNTGNPLNPLTVSVGTVSSPVTKLLNVHGKIWCAIQGTIKVLNVQQLQIENVLQISTESKPITNMVASTNCVWVTIQNSSIIKCYHSTGHELLFEIDVSNPVNKMLSSCDDIIRQHKAACLRITALLACKDLLWIGTSAGVLLNLPVSNCTKGLQHIVSSLTGLPYGHTGHVRFLTSVELNCSGISSSSAHSSKASTTTTSSGSAAGSNSSSSGGSANRTPTTLIISGGDGYEDFRSTSANSANDVAGREDSTNHLLLWQV